MSDEFDTGVVGSDISEETGPRRQRIFWMVVAGVAAADVGGQLTLRPTTPGGTGGQDSPGRRCGKLIGLHVEPLTGDTGEVLS